MKSDEDTRVSKYQGMQQEMVQLAADLGAETAYIEPEILKMEPAVVERFVSQEPRLKIYRVYLDDIQRRRAHTGTDAEENACWRAPRYWPMGLRRSTASCPTPTFPTPQSR